jgi:hypothetical protein
MASPEDGEPISPKANITTTHQRAVTERSGDRWAAIAGLTFIIFNLVNLLTPMRTDPRLPVADYTAQHTADLTGHQMSLWLGFLAHGAFIVFLAGLCRRVRRFERPGDLFASTLLIAGTAFVTVLLAWLGCYLALVQYGSTSEPDTATLTTLTVLVDWLGSAQLLPAMVAETAVAAAILTTGALPRWLGWLSAVAAAFTVLTLAYNVQIASGGVLGIADAIGFWFTVAWFSAGSLMLLLRAGEQPGSR